MQSKSIAAWDDMDKCKKAAFIMSVKDLMGRDLRSRLRQFLEEDIESRECISLSATGRYFDSPDLRGKYKHKPEQLRIIRANTKKRVCPLSGVTLYEDMQYESNFKADQVRIVKRRMNCLAGRTSRLQVAAGADGTSKISQNQQHKLDDWLEFVKASQEGLETCEADIKVLGKCIPQVNYVIASETLTHAQNIVSTMRALCDAIKESGECRDFVCFWNIMCDYKKELIKKTITLDTQVREAKSQTRKRVAKDLTKKKMPKK